MSNALTTPTPAAVAEAQGVLARHQAATSQPAGPGGHAAAATSSPAIRAVDAKINAIMALAHGGMIDGDEYERRQPELLELVAEKNVLLRGSAAAPSASRTAVAPAVRATSSVPASRAAIQNYPTLVSQLRFSSRTWKGLAAAAAEAAKIGHLGRASRRSGAHCPGGGDRRRCPACRTRAPCP